MGLAGCGCTRGEQRNVRDTLKPNLSGYSAKRRLRRVLFPTPDGPDMSSGRRKSGRGGMSPMGVGGSREQEQMEDGDKEWNGRVLRATAASPKKRKQNQAASVRQQKSANTSLSMESQFGQSLTLGRQPEPKRDRWRRRAGVHLPNAGNTRGLRNKHGQQLAAVLAVAIK